MTITGLQLKQIGKTMFSVAATNWANAFNEVLPLYRMDSPDVFHEFIANVMEESSELSRMEENLSYSAKRMHEVWPSRFPTVESGLPYQYNPQKLAQKVYDKRKDLGNDQPGDGFAFRGSGPIQITGRSNHTLFTLYYNKLTGKSLNIDTVANLIRTDITVGAHSACWVFSIAKKLIPLAINDEMKTICKRINGGLTGYPKRLMYYERAKIAIPE